MIRPTIRATILVLLAGVGPVGVMGQPPAPEGNALARAADLHRRLRDADQAGKGAEVEALLPQFRAAVQGAAPHLPEVTPEEAAKPKAYRKLTLNAGAARLDGFRFRAPASEPAWDLAWEFVCPKGAPGFTWGLAASKGEVEGFKTFTSRNNHAEKGAELPKENRQVRQRLSGGKLKGGAEYVIWFAFEQAQPVEIHVRLGLTPGRR